MTRHHPVRIHTFCLLPSASCRLPPASWLLAFALCLLLSAFCLPVFAQSATATLSGVIEDQNNAVVSGVEVTIENTGTTLQRQITTNSDGYFTVSLLPPGRYTVTARREGFAAIQVPDVVLNVNDQKALKIQLKTGDVKATVQVTTDAPLINQSPAVATVIDRQFVSNLPLNGRSFQSLILLTPGVTITTSSGASDYGEFSVNGQRASTNYFTVDGVSANIGAPPDATGANNLSLSGAYPGTSAFGGTNNLVSIDALEEFRIQTSTYTAEYGRQPGGQVQLVTRSGGNQFHGTVFEYFRNDKLDARDYFNFKPAPKPPLRQNQFGGTFSGPVMLPRFGEGGKTYWSGRNKTFFFFSYEGQRLLLPTSGIKDVPSLRLRQLAAPALRPVLDAFALPTGPEYLVTCDPVTDPGCSTQGTKPNGFAPYNFGVSNPSNLDATSIRIDHTFGSKLSLFGRFNESPSDTTTGEEHWFRIIAKTRTLTLGATSVLSARLSNELRFNYSRQQRVGDFVLTTIGGAVPVDPLLITSGYDDYGNASFSTDSGCCATINAGKIRDNLQRQFNVVDNLSLAVGAHQLKFGVDFRRLSPIYHGIFDQEALSFDRESSIITGTVDFLDLITFQPARPQFDNYSAYAQDTWKASGRLTLDLGVRWEINPAPTEAEGRMPPLAIGIVGTDVSKATLAPPGSQFYKTFYTAFAPRFGVAYLLNQTAGRETVLRGGFGVYYDLGSGTAANGWPLTAERHLRAGDATGGCPMIFPISPACAVRPGVVLVTTLPTTTTINTPNETLKLPYSLHWNVGVEQSLGKEQTVSISYVASVARRLLTTQNLNARPRPFAPRPNPNFGPIVYSYNAPTANYHSMQAQYRARLKQGLQALVNYTWSHAIDETSSDIQQQPVVFERANANFDVRHNFSAALHYDIPALGAGPVVKTILRNWSVDTIVHAQTGRPIDLSSSSFGNLNLPDGRSFSLRPDLVVGVPLYISDPAVPGGRRFNAAAFRATPRAPVEVVFPNGIRRILQLPFRQGNFGRNVLRELPLYQVDLALGRTFRFSESWKVQLKAEAFNVFNHPLFFGYRDDFRSPSTFGVPFLTLSRGLGGLSSVSWNHR